METPIHQNSRPVQKIFALWLPITATVLVTLLMIYVYFSGQKNVRLLLEADVVLSALLSLLCITLAYALRPRAQWTLADTGLTRIKPTAHKQFVQWNQILKMKITLNTPSIVTLVIKWRDDPASPATHSDLLFITQDDANNLISTWRQHVVPAGPTKTSPQPINLPKL